MVWLKEKKGENYNLVVFEATVLLLCIPMAMSPYTVFVFIFVFGYHSTQMSDECYFCSTETNMRDPTNVEQRFGFISSCSSVFPNRTQFQQFEEDHGLTVSILKAFRAFIFIISFLGLNCLL